MDNPKLSLMNTSKTAVESKSVFWKDVKVPDKATCVSTMGLKYNTDEHRYLIKKRTFQKNPALPPRSLTDA